MPQLRIFPDGQLELVALSNRDEFGIPVLRHMSGAYLWIALIGAPGSVARHWLHEAISPAGSTPFPWVTLPANVTGSLLIGALGALTGTPERLSAKARTWTTQFLMAGVCGGFTTFSSFNLQTLRRLREREWLYAGGNILLSVRLCLLATGLGFLLTTTLLRAKGH